MWRNYLVGHQSARIASCSFPHLCPIFNALGNPIFLCWNSLTSQAYVRGDALRICRWTLYRQKLETLRYLFYIHPTFIHFWHTISVWWMDRNTTATAMRHTNYKISEQTHKQTAIVNKHYAPRWRRSANECQHRPDLNINHTHTRYSQLTQHKFLHPDPKSNQSLPVWKISWPVFKRRLMPRELQINQRLVTNWSQSQEIIVNSGLRSDIGLKITELGVTGPTSSLG